jgi:CheY-like chemotaxis protein
MPTAASPRLQPQKLPGVPLPDAVDPSVFGGAVQAPPRLAGVRILVVEDDADGRELICYLLEMAGAKVLCVGSVAEAMDGVNHSFDPDVVLTDFSMPGADGLDLIREFRAKASTRAVAVPILVLSGHSEVHWRERALAAGAADLLVKPFDPAFLITRLAQAAALGRTGAAA